MGVYIGDVGIGSKELCTTCHHRIEDHNLWEPAGVFMECLEGWEPLKELQPNQCSCKEAIQKEVIV